MRSNAGEEPDVPKGADQVAGAENRKGISAREAPSKRMKLIREQGIT
jgi:hypothetical protein